MRIKKEVNGVQIQIKSIGPKKQRSQSFTIHNTEVNETYNRIYFLFEQLSQNTDEIKIIHYNKKNINEET